MSKFDATMKLSSDAEGQTDQSQESKEYLPFLAGSKQLNGTSLTQQQVNSEFTLLIKHLLHENNETHVEILHSLRRLLKHYVFPGNLVLPEFSKQIIFNKFHQFLSGEQTSPQINRILTEYTMLVAELIPNVPMHTLEQDDCLFLVLPYIVPNLGHEAIDVRRATLRLLHVYMRYTKHLNGFIELYIAHGLKSKQKNAQKGCILSLPLLFTQEFFNGQDGDLATLGDPKAPPGINLFPLLQCLSDLLISADSRLFYAIYLAIQRLHTLLGNRVFKLYLQRVDQEAALLYNKVLSRNTSTASSNAVQEQLTQESDPMKEGDLMGTGKNVDRLVMPDNANVEENFKTMDAKKQIEETLNGKEFPSKDDDAISLEKIISTRGEVSHFEKFDKFDKFDKYDKLMLDQLVSSEEEVRKQSFEILSSPTSLIHEEANTDEDLSDPNKQFTLLQQQPVAYTPKFDPPSNRSPYHFKTKKIEIAEQETKKAIKEQIPTTTTGSKVYPVSNPYNRPPSTSFNLSTSNLREERQSAHFHSHQNQLSQERKKGKTSAPHQLPAKKDTLSSSKLELGFEDNTLLYGIYPSYIVQKALSSKLALKNEAINQLLNITRNIPCTQLTIITLNNNLHNFLLQFLVKLIDHPNFKITLQALELIEVLVNRLKNQLLKYLPTLISCLVKRLGDARVVVKQQTIQIVHLITLKLPTQAVLDALIPHLTNRNPRVRTEIVNRITVILLLIPRDQFNLCALCYDLSSLLVDEKRIVRQAVLECMACLAQCLGPERMRKLIRCAEAIERVQDQPGLVAAVKARLARRDLPRVMPDATIRYVLNPNGFPGWYASIVDADIDYILQGSTSATSTPPKLAMKTPVNYCASYQDLTSSQSLCHMKRNSCVLNPSDTERVQQQQQMSSSSAYETAYENGFKQSDNQQAPPDTAGKKSDSTVEIERIIEKNTTDQLKSRELSTGDSNFSMQSEEQSEDSRELWRYYHQRFKGNLNNESNLDPYFDKRDFQLDFEESNELINRGRGSANDLNIDQNRDNSANYLNSPKFKPSSKAISMPAISSAQLSDISERTEYTTKSQLQKPDLESEKRNGGGGGGGHRRHSECGQSSYASDGEVSDEKSSPHSAMEHHPKITMQSSMKNEIEINIHKASTISEDSKSTAMPDGNKLGNELRKSKGMTKVKSDETINGEMRDDASGKEDEEQRDSDAPSPSPTTTKKKDSDSADKRKVSMAVPVSYEITDDESERKEHIIRISKEGDTSSKWGEKEPKVETYHDMSHRKSIERSNQVPGQLTVKKRECRSTSPRERRRSTHGELSFISGGQQPCNHQQTSHQQLLRIQPAIPANANIRNILENVSRSEGPFKEPEEALKAAIGAFTQDAWTTKIEAMLAITRLSTFHPNVLKRELHTVVLALAYEVKNLRSTVARSAIYTIGDLLTKMRGYVDLEMEIIAQALLNKSGENLQFMREDIDKALKNFVTYMPPVRAALAIINHGANHRNVLVRRISSNYLADLIEQMGATKSLMGPKDLAENLLPTSAALLLDRDAHTRYSARRIFNVLLNHSQFNSLLSKYVQPATYRAIIGSLASIKRRGVGDKPKENL